MNLWTDRLQIVYLLKSHCDFIYWWFIWITHQFNGYLKEINPELIHKLIQISLAIQLGHLRHNFSRFQLFVSFYGFLLPKCQSASRWTCLLIYICLQVFQISLRQLRMIQLYFIRLFYFTSKKVFWYSKNLFTLPLQTFLQCRYHIFT